MSGCHPSETLSVCKHGLPVKFGCYACLDEDEKEPVAPIIQQIQKICERLDKLEDPKYWGTQYRSSQLWATIETILEETENHEEQLQECHKHINRLYKLESKVEKLEIRNTAQLVQELSAAKLFEILNYPGIREELKKLKEEIKSKPELSYIQESIKTHFDSRFNELETQLEIVRALGSRAYHPKKPHKCPICDGTRTCHSKESVLSWQCESCEGKGVLWG